MLILFVYKLMMRNITLKITEKIIRENAFEHQKKKPGLSANQPLNNWAQLVFKQSVEHVGGQPPDCKFNTLKHCLYPEIMPSPYKSVSLRGRDFSSSPTPPTPQKS